MNAIWFCLETKRYPSATESGSARCQIRTILPPRRGNEGEAGAAPAPKLAQPSIAPSDAPLFDGAILLLDDSGGARHATVLTDAGYRVIPLRHPAALAATARRHKDVVLVVVRQQTPASQELVSRQLAMLRTERPWLEYLMLAGAGVEPASRADAERMLRGDDTEDFLTATAEAFNLARLQQVQAGEKRSLEQALNDYKSRADSAYAQLVSQVRGGPQPASDDAGSHQAPMPDELARLVADERARARIRERLFGPLALGHAGWLLVLALADASDGELTVKSAAHTAGLPLSSALRKINELCERRLLTRRRDTTDARRSFVRLTERMRDALRDYFAAVDAGRKR